VNVFDGPAQDPYAAPQAPEWLASAHAVATCAEACLGPALVGVYLHGSAALGGWLAHVSDLDILVVTDGPATRGSLVPFGEEISGLARSGPASGIELSVIDRELARDPRAPWNYLLHLAVPCDPRSSPRVVFDDGAGDPDLLMHIAVTRAAGVAVRGPDAADLFGDPARHSVLAYLASELEWALGQAPETYAVLNACRALAYLEDGLIVSKVAGGASGIARLPQHQALIARALEEQRCGLPSRDAGAEARALVTAVVGELRTAADEPTINL
jgi:streptomycin 3"-adenylyltransferase